MRVVVTGGGTGGHVFPALEVARAFQEQGEDVQYFGSLRGQEERHCRNASIAFQGFPSEPLYSLKTLRGLKGAMNLARATVLARRALMVLRPDVVFSTGGYASAPVVHAADKLGIPFVIHEQNVVPGRTNRILGQRAFCVSTTFRSGAEHFPSAKVIRTGMPIRSEFRAGQGSLGLVREHTDPMLLVMGGSQGAQAINEAAMATAVRMVRTPLQWLHVAGPKHYEGMSGSVEKLGLDSRYVLRAFLESSDMATAMMGCELAICRSGAGTLAELAALRKPAILIPYPHSFADHQLANAREFEEMGAATILEEKDLQPAALESRILSWLGEADRQEAARVAMAEWDLPDSVSRITGLLREAAGKVALLA